MVNIKIARFQLQEDYSNLLKIHSVHFTQLTPIVDEQIPPSNEKIYVT